MIKEFCNYLESNLDLSMGSTLFVGRIPPESGDLCSVVLERSGERVDPLNEKMRFKAVQILTRGKTYFSARDEAHRIFDEIINIAGVEVSGYTILSITGNAPSDIGQDSKDRFEFTCNVIVSYKKA